MSLNDSFYIYFQELDSINHDFLVEKLVILDLTKYQLKGSSERGEWVNLDKECIFQSWEMRHLLLSCGVGVYLSEVTCSIQCVSK